MRLLPVWVVTVAGWVVSAAPGPAHNPALAPSPAHSPTPGHTSAPAPHPAPMEVTGADLGGALRALARRKRGNNKSNLPYSNYRPVAGIHRYRYPLYKKRSYPSQYDYQDDLLLPEDDFLGYRDQEEGEGGSYSPSLFRERNRKESDLFEDDGFFTDDYYPLDAEDDHDENGGRRNELDRKKDYLYNLYNLPYSDLERLNYMYEVGKRDSDLGSFDLPAGVMGQLHGVGRKTYAPSASERFYDAIDYVRGEEEERRKRKKSEGVDKRGDYDAVRGEKLRKLQHDLTSAAGRYWRDREVEEEPQGRSTTADPMIRRKRDTNKAKPATSKSTTTKNTITSSTSASTTPSMRGKRAFSDYFKYEKKRPASSYDDFLTREYFKSIARSVGQKKKRMAYAQFEANYPESSKRSNGQVMRSGAGQQAAKGSTGHGQSQGAAKRSSGHGQSQAAAKRSSGYGQGRSIAKRSGGQVKRSEGGPEAAKRSDQVTVKRAGYNMDELLRSPSMLHYMQDKLKEAEEVVAREAQERVTEGDTDKLISNIVVRLDALDRMRGALRQLEQLQQQDDHDMRKKDGSQAAAEDGTRGLSHKRSVRVRLRRGDGDLSDLFLGNPREDCPVLQRLVVNCEGVSDEVGDEDQVFLPHCLRHEICYMCGSGESVTGHECDAILSSGLEAACSGANSQTYTRSLDCLSAAGSTFNLLSDHSRYEEDGACTQDPCVRRFLESR